MRSFPFLNLLLVLLPLQMITLIAQRLQIVPVVKEVRTNRPWDLVVHAGGRLDDSFLLALLTKRMTRPEGLAQGVPPP